MSARQTPASSTARAAPAGGRRVAATPVRARGSDVADEPRVEPDSAAGAAGAAAARPLEIAGPAEAQVPVEPEPALVGRPRDPAPALEHEAGEPPAPEPRARGARHSGRAIELTSRGPGQAGGRRPGTRRPKRARPEIQAPRGRLRSRLLPGAPRAAAAAAVRRLAEPIEPEEGCGGTRPAVPATRAEPRREEPVPVAPQPAHPSRAARVGRISRAKEVLTCGRLPRRRPRGRARRRRAAGAGGCPRVGAGAGGGALHVAIDAIQIVTPPAAPPAATRSRRSRPRPAHLCTEGRRVGGVTAIQGVDDTLKKIARTRRSSLANAPKITVGPLRPRATDLRLNWFLYRISPHPAYRNMEPPRHGDADRARAPAARAPAPLPAHGVPGRRRRTAATRSSSRTRRWPRPCARCTRTRSSARPTRSCPRSRSRWSSRCASRWSRSTSRR